MYTSNVAGGLYILHPRVFSALEINVFAGGSLHEVRIVNLGLEFTGSWLIFTKYIMFLTRYTHHVWPSYPTIRWTLTALVKCHSQYNCMYDRFTVSDIKLDLLVDDFRSRSRHLSAPTHRPGPSGSLKLRTFIITLSRSPKSWFSGNWNKKGRGLLQIYFNGKIFGTFSRLIGHQRGLSIYCTYWGTGGREIDLWGRPPIVLQLYT